MTGIEQRLIGMFDNATVIWVVVGVAFLAGAMHALAPGHGKTIAAAYLVGARRRYRDAAVLGGIVAGMHTFSVLVLALVWVGVSGVASLGTEAVTAWLQVVAGLVVVGVGGYLTARQLRSRRVPVHAGHGHGHGHGHEDAPLPWSGKGLVALGLSGGLLPSPSAFLVLVSGLLTGRAVYAVVLVAVFGIGLAATLTVVGLLAVRGQSLLSARAAAGSERLGALVAWLPVAGGVVVLLGGLVYLGAAVSVLAG